MTISTYQRQFNKQLPVWVHAYARSGSSTVLSMVSQAFQEVAAEEHGEMQQFLNNISTPAISLAIESQFSKSKEQFGHVFSLFEPCHKGDELTPELEAKGCSGLIHELANCRFDKIKALNGWHDTHSKTRGVGDYDSKAASAACRSADVVTFKTISQAGEVFNFNEQGLPLLQKNKRLRMVAIVRDPRSIYASWMSTFPFNDTALGGVQRDPTLLKDLCSSFATALDVKHPRVRQVVFESLVRDPETVMRDVFKFMKVPFGDSQKEWLQETFNAKDCPGVDQYIAPYSDCHTNATASLEKWRNVLQPHEVETFATFPACQTVARAYNYSMV